MIGNINNGEDGLSVRNKLNEVIDIVNFTPDMSNFAVLTGGNTFSGVQLFQDNININNDYGFGNEVRIGNDHPFSFLKIDTNSVTNPGSFYTGILIEDTGDYSNQISVSLSAFEPENYGNPTFIIDGGGYSPNGNNILSAYNGAVYFNKDTTFRYAVNFSNSPLIDFTNANVVGLSVPPGETGATGPAGVDGTNVLYKAGFDLIYTIPVYNGHEGAQFDTIYIATGLSYTPNDYFIMYCGFEQYIIGQVVSYIGTTGELWFSLSGASGSGTAGTHFFINFSARPGESGSSGTSGTSGVGGGSGGGGLVVGTGLYSIKTDNSLTDPLSISTAATDYSIAIGSGATVVGTLGNGVAIGYNVKLFEAGGVAIGSNVNQTTGFTYKSIAIGTNCRASAIDTIAIGNGCHTGNESGGDRISIGSQASTGSDGAVAIGAYSYADAYGAIALGADAHATTAHTATVKRLQWQDWQFLGFLDDTAAEAGGIPLGGLYHSSGIVQIRIV